MFRVFTVFNNGFSDLCLNQHAKYCKKKIRACLSLFSDQLLSSQNIFLFSDQLLSSQNIFCF